METNIELLGIKMHYMISLVFIILLFRNGISYFYYFNKGGKIPWKQTELLGMESQFLPF